MRWFEVALQILGIFLVGNGLVQWFGWLRIERDAVVTARTRRVAGTLIVLGVLVLVVQALLV